LLIINLSYATVLIKQGDKIIQCNNFNAVNHYGPGTG